jgi:hypothetical protein
MKRIIITIITWPLLALSLLASVPLALAGTANPEAVRAAFYPYRAGALHQQGITPGTAISQRNWRLAERVLPAEILRLVQAGDFTITVQETTDLPVRPPYIRATLEHFQAVSLNGGYYIDHYQGGLPFPVLDVADPRAGEKAAWNFRYRDMPQTMEMRGTMRGVNNSGNIDRSGTGRMRFRYGMYRVGGEENDPQWQERGVRLKAIFEALAPSDMEGYVQITTIYDSDAQAHDNMSYNPQNRRTRKSYENMLTRMGFGRFDLLQEEQPPFFFIGYLHEYNWTYRGEQVMLVPGFLRADHVAYGGKNNWYPDVPWELRRVAVLESTPKGTHPYGKRVFYLDTQTYTPFYVLSYDPQGVFACLNLVVHGNPDFVPGARDVRLPVPLGGTWVNFAQDHASQFVVSQASFNQRISPRRFDMAELLRRGK